MTSLFASFAPRSEYTFADVVDELRELRAANKVLTGEKELLKAQVAMLSQQRVGVTEAPSKPSAEILDAPLSSPSVDGADASTNSALEAHAATADSLLALRSELAVNLGIDKQQAEASQLKALAEQLAAARTQADALFTERDAVTGALRAEIQSLELEKEAVQLDAALGVEGLRTHCAELQAALDEQALRAHQAQRAALATARKQSASRMAALEEQLAAMQDAAAQQDLLLNELGSDSLLEDERRQRVAWMAKCQVREQELRAARHELATVDERHSSKARAAEEESARLEAQLAAARRQVADHEAAQQRHHAVVERLTQSFDRQVEEAAGLRAQLSRLEAANAGMIEKREARAWIVNFVENADRRPALLQLMASWWDFDQADRLRVGLLDEPPPNQRLDTPSLSDAFASFLDHESELNPQHKPSSPWSTLR